MKSLVVFALIVLSATASQAQRFTLIDKGGPSHVTGFAAASPAINHLKCEYTGSTTAICSCNHEPNAMHEAACLNVLRAACGPVRNGEAICPVDPD